MQPLSCFLPRVLPSWAGGAARAGRVVRIAAAVLAAGAAIAAALLAGCEAQRHEGWDPPAGLVHFQQAERFVQPLARTAATGLLDRLQLEQAAWTPVALPDHAARTAVVEPAGRMRAAVAWYRMRYEVPPAAALNPPPALAVYVPRALGAPAELYLDGTLLLDNRAQLREQWNRPLFASLPAALLQARAGQAVELLVGLPHEPGLRAHALSSVWVGPVADLRPMLELRRTLQVTGPQVSALTVLLLGVFALALWSCRRHEQAYLMFGAASLAWWLRNLHYHVDVPTGWWAQAWFWWATHASMSWIMVLTYLFATHLYGVSHRGAGRVLAGSAVAVSLATLPVLPWEPGRLLVAQHLLNALVCGGVLALISVQAWRRRVPELTVLCVVLWAGLAIGVHDLLLVSLVISPESVYLMPYVSLLLFGAFLYALQRRYLRAMAEVEQAHSTLEARLGERQSLLDASWQQLRDAERQQAVLRERQRLMRDMHDGVGSALMSSLVLVEQGHLDTRAVAELLRECMDDIRLVIDSMEPVDHDLVALLASLRYRLGRRMELAGVRLDWHVRDVPRLEWMDAGSALQILRIVQESLTNVLKHAQAQSVVLATDLHDDGGRQWVRVTVTDDGGGFDMAHLEAQGEGHANGHGNGNGSGRGLRNLRSRARALHGRLDVQSKPGCTEVTLDLPVQAG
jgi:signal transduction histidine kinase